VKEAAFGDAGGGADVIDGAAGIPFGANDIAGGVEQFGAGFRSGLRLELLASSPRCAG